MEEKTEFDLQVKMNPRSRGAPWPGPRWPRARRSRELAMHRRWKLDDGSSERFAVEKPLRNPRAARQKFVLRALPLSVAAPGRDSAQTAEGRHFPGHAPRSSRAELGAMLEPGCSCGARVPPGFAGSSGGRRGAAVLRFHSHAPCGAGTAAPRPRAPRERSPLPWARAAAPPAPPRHRARRTLVAPEHFELLPPRSVGLIYPFGGYFRQAASQAGRAAGGRARGRGGMREQGSGAGRD